MQVLGDFLGYKLTSDEVRKMQKPSGSFSCGALSVLMRSRPCHSIGRSGGVDLDQLSLLSARSGTRVMAPGLFGNASSRVLDRGRYPHVFRRRAERIRAVSSRALVSASLIT